MYPLLSRDRSCVLTSLDDGKAGVIFPETGEGVQPVPLQMLADEYTGYAIFATREARLDQRADRIRLLKGKRWFWDVLLYYMLLRASTLAGVTEFIRSNPAGFGAQVGERGMSLSGGQRQAVALARALVRDPDILILDEPTSNMDNASEQMIKNRLKAVMGNKTLVLITHRLSMLELVDRLIVMEGGRIIADGPKNEVLRRLREQPAPRTEQ